MTVQHSRPGRLGPVFESCAADGRAALIGYLPTGYPDVATSIEAMVAMAESGCDII
jgi:tryptophan synthase alpha chain